MDDRQDELLTSGYLCNCIYEQELCSLWIMEVINQNRLQQLCGKGSVEAQEQESTKRQSNGALGGLEHVCRL
jgi:hypothetical protein